MIPESANHPSEPLSDVLGLLVQTLAQLLPIFFSLAAIRLPIIFRYT
jgi:hypothetical protein